MKRADVSILDKTKQTCLKINRNFDLMIVYVLISSFRFVDCHCINKFYNNSQMPGFARLCSRSQFWFVGVSRLFFAKFVLSRFLRTVLLQVHTQLTLTGSHVKTFGQNGTIGGKSRNFSRCCHIKNVRFLPGIFLHHVTQGFSGFRKSKHYKNLLRIVGGDSK